MSVIPVISILHPFQGLTMPPLRAEMDSESSDLVGVLEDVNFHPGNPAVFATTCHSQANMRGEKQESQAIAIKELHNRGVPEKWGQTWMPKKNWAREHHPFVCHQDVISICQGHAETRELLKACEKVHLGMMTKHGFQCTELPTPQVRHRISRLDLFRNWIWRANEAAIPWATHLSGLPSTKKDKPLGDPQGIKSPHFQQRFGVLPRNPLSFCSPSHSPQVISCISTPPWLPRCPGDGREFGNMTSPADPNRWWFLGPKIPKEERIYHQWPFQDPKMEVLYHIRPYIW